MSKVNVNPQTVDHLRENARITGQAIWGETPTGLVDGANDTFTLKNIPKDGTLRLMHGATALTLMRVAQSEYTTAIDAVTKLFTITFTAAPGAGVLLADYSA